MSSSRQAEERETNTDRAAVVRSYLHKSVELTESLVREHQSLEHELQRVRTENEHLRAQLASLSSQDAVRDLLVNIEGLQRDRSLLQQNSLKFERELGEHGERAAHVEHELNNLASLYVASSQLNGTLAIGRVIKHVCELLEQLVGAQRFVLYVIDQDGKRGMPVGSRGCGVTQLPNISLSEGVVADACLTGVARVVDDPVRVDEAGAGPIAVLPLGFDGESVAVIVVERLLPHKKAWENVDRELFKLLSTQGAVALISANLYAREAGPRAALHDVFARLERERVRYLTEADNQGGGDA